MIKWHYLLVLISIGLFESACGNGFSVATHLSDTYTGSPGDYCQLPANYPGLINQESIPSTSQLSALRSAANTLVTQNKLQEAIWLYQDDPQNVSTATSLKQQLHTILNSDDYQVSDSNLGGAYEKYLVTFSNGVKGVFKPTSSGGAELAAYRLDHLLRLGLVPMTIFRSINGRTGTLQYFVDGMSSGVVSQIGSINFRKMIIFDFLLRNRDRDLNNFLYWPSQVRIIAIDNGAAFYLPCGVPDEIKKHLEIEKTLATRISDLTAKQLADALGDSPLDYKKMIWKQINEIKN